MDRKGSDKERRKTIQLRSYMYFNILFLENQVTTHIQGHRARFSSCQERAVSENSFPGEMECWNHVFCE
jgi:hypothetical protein